MSAILTVQEVAQRMRCEHRTVRRAIRSGELEAAFIGGRWLVREEAVDDWFRSRCASPEPVLASPRAPARRVPAPEEPTAPRASNDCGRWRGEADERSQARQAVRGQVDRGWPKALTELPARGRRQGVRHRHQTPQAARRTGPGHHPVAQDARRVRGGGVVAALRDPQPRARHAPPLPRDMERAPAAAPRRLRAARDHADGRRGLPRADESSEGGRADAAQGTDAASGHPQARGRARAHSDQSSAAGRQAQAEADTASAAALASDDRADPREACSNRGPGSFRRRAPASGRAANTRLRSDPHASGSETR